MMTTMYDAALDKLQEHKWEVPDERNDRRYISVHWADAITAERMDGGAVEIPHPVILPGLGTGNTDFGYESGLDGKVAGLNISSAAGLKEVVISRVYRTREQTTGSSTIITRGVSSTGGLEAYKQPLVILDGEIFTGNLKDIKEETITDGLIFKGEEAKALYGAAAAKGVLVLSTKGPIVLPTPPEPVIKVRKDFNETAFFFPQVHAGKDGLYSFDFTMPETATEWNWKMMAHTRNARFVYLEKKLQTQLNLMVQPNMPRVLYQRDLIALPARISNLDTVAVTGKATCTIEDAVTGQDITARLMADNTLPFSVTAKSTGHVTFSLVVPAGQLNPLKFTIKAATASIADAEEHVIPVLSTRVFVRQSVPVRFDQQAAISIKPVIPADADMYGVGITIDQKPQASLLYALPWLANYPYDCAEQTFNKLRANYMARKLMRTDTGAQNAFKRASAFVGDGKAKAPVLPDALAATATPWLTLADRATDQQGKLFRMLDTSIANGQISGHLDRLYKLQQSDGGLSWFDGGKSNSYISAYVLAGFGQIKQPAPLIRYGDPNAEKRFKDKLMGYVEGLLFADGRQPDLYTLYALSYWLDQPGLRERISARAQLILDDQWRTVDKASLQKQALLIITTLRLSGTEDALHQKALGQLQSIRQLAINDEVNGIRWKDIADSDDLNSSAGETMALLAEAFETSGRHKDVNAGIVKWLLSAKQDQNWQTTKATAGAIDLLQKAKGSAFGDNKAFSAELETGRLSVSDDLLKGTPEAFVQTRTAPQAVTLKQQGTATSGALTYYYFAGADNLDTLNKAVKISKQLSYFDNLLYTWKDVTERTVLRPGDKLRVTLSVNTGKRLRFVNISDPRAAAFEPADQLSGYRNDGVAHYRSVKDTGLEIFAEDLPAGITSFTYDMVMVYDGLFSSGPARLQCMYAPGVTAYSKVVKFNTK